MCIRDSRGIAEIFTETGRPGRASAGAASFFRKDPCIDDNKCPARSGAGHLPYSESRRRSTMVCLETERYTARGTREPSRANTGATARMGTRVKR